MTTYKGPGGHSFFIEFFKRVTDLAYGVRLYDRLESQKTGFGSVLASAGRCKLCARLTRIYYHSSYVCGICRHSMTQTTSTQAEPFFEFFGKYLLAARLPIMAIELESIFHDLNNEWRASACWGCKTHSGLNCVYCPLPGTKKMRVVKCSAPWCTVSDAIPCSWCQKSVCSEFISRCTVCAAHFCDTCHARYACEGCRIHLCTACHPVRRPYFYRELPVLWCEPCIAKEEEQRTVKRLKTE